VTISKVDAVKMTPTQAAAGKAMWQRTGQVGRFAKSSFNAEEMAPKTWIQWVNNKGEQEAVIECELYAVGRRTDSKEAVAMLHGMCPKCGETFVVTEDNKSWSIDYVRFRKAPKFLREHFLQYCMTKLGRRVSDDDKIPVISSSEPWLCDYCHEWGVKVTGGIAFPDMTRVRKIHIDMSTGRAVPGSGKIEL